MFTVLHRLFFGTYVFQAENLSSAPSTAQSKYIYTIFKVENQVIQFPLLCTKPSIAKHKLLSFKGRLSLGRFIGQSCHSRIEWAAKKFVPHSLIEQAVLSSILAK